MKKLLALLPMIAFCFITSIAQVKTVPEVNVKNIDGQVVNSSTFSNDGKPYIINFWATWCSPCKRELSAIADVYDDWVEETGVKLYAVSIDDPRTSRNVKPYINGVAWDFEVILDENSDLKRAMGVAAPPYTFLVDGDGKIVYQHIGYNPGDEEELYEHLLKISK